MQNKPLVVVIIICDNFQSKLFHFETMDFQNALFIPVLTEINKYDYFFEIWNF